METQPKIKKLQDNWLLIVGMICVAATLRSPLTSVGPVIKDITRALDINSIIAGLLTTIPLITFGIISPFVPKLVNKISMSRLIIYSIIILTIGLCLRISGGIWVFLVGTVIIGIGIAICNVTLPSYVKWNFPLQIGIVTGIYSSTMNFTAGLGGGLSYPLGLWNGYGYVVSLGFWIIFSIIAFIAWMPQVKTIKAENTESLTTEVKQKTFKVFKSNLAWMVALTMGFQSMIFYTTVAWLPLIISSKGVNEINAGYYLMLNQFAQVPMTFLFPIVAARLKDQKVLIYIIGLLYVIGFSLLFLSNAWLILAMIISGLAAGASFSICMTFFSLRASTSDGSVALSGFGQSIGYFIAAIGPFLLGYIYDKTNDWNIGIITIIAMVIGFVIFGIFSSKNITVEDQLLKKAPEQ